VTTREEFDSLVRRVEREFEGRPGPLRRRVVALALFGFAGLLAWLAVVALISGAFFALMGWVDRDGKIACAVLGTLFLIGGGYAALRALLVRVPKPKGRAVTRAEAPELFALLDDLRSQLRSAGFHEVLIEPVCNAAVIQVPRLGVFGWQRNYLLLGLPLLDGFSAEEMRAVIAHEFAHLSRDHGRLSHWLYRLRRSWEEVFEQLSSPRPAGEISLRPVIQKFIDWFWPRFNAHAFVLSRSNEYEADAQSARLAGAGHAASALSRLSVLSRQVEDKLWPGFYELANEHAEPPEDLFRRLRDGIRAGAAPEEAAGWLNEGLQMASTNSDTHPCLTERLRALRVEPARDMHAAPRPSAAEALLGASLETIRADLQKAWAKEMGSKWRDRHARAGALRQRITEIERVGGAAAEDPDRLWDKAMAMLDLKGWTAAKPLMERVLELEPDHVHARFHFGRLLLEDNSADGVGHLQRAMELDEECVPHACQLLHNHYRRIGETARLRELDARMDRHETALAASHAERSEVSARDTFLPHGLTETELGAVRQALDGEPRVSRAHLARKELKHFPTQRLFVLCVCPVRKWHRLPEHEADRALINRLSAGLQLPGRLLVISSSGSFRALARKVAGTPGTEIFRRA
jgi:Zn-dependent protease with chaperone function